MLTEKLNEEEAYSRQHNGPVDGFNAALIKTDEWREFVKVSLPREPEKLLALLDKNLRRVRDIVIFNANGLRDDIAFKLSIKTNQKGQQRQSWKKVESELLYTLLNCENFKYSVTSGKCLVDLRAKPPKLIMNCLETALGGLNA
ncbi:hypothetical protein [Stieleria mannarensis]|uniref:hypothetical protein n=1 Tax=Stieleria mannarensis TaxID=2755585 RepID=UPI001602ED34|nr:hypothetical protein [Rhodopirellula sp. JC639]